MWKRFGMTYGGEYERKLGRKNPLIKRETWLNKFTKILGATFICSSLNILPAYAQTSDLIECAGRVVRSLEFTNNTFISGPNNNEQGAVYRYSNVGDGVDAEVTIIGFTGGGGITIIDRDVPEDPDPDFLPNNFQPEFDASGLSTARFRINFFVAGTNTPIKIDFAASAIDVDGNQNAMTTVGLRELVEYENGFVESILNSSTELLTNASGPTSGFTRFQSATDQFAPGIDETAEDNIVTTFYTDVSEFDYIIGTVGNGTQNRLTSLGFNCPNLSSPVTNSVVDEDFGDAPSSYGNPIHTLVNGIRLGPSNSADVGPFNSATASGDTADDGIAIPALTQTAEATITANVVGSGGYLQGWIDWNGNGSFSDSGEQIALNLQDSDNDGVIDVPVTVPSSTTTGQTFARFRWSTSAGIVINTAVSDGEVEDYAIPSIIEANVDLDAVKSVEVYDPTDIGLYMTPGNEVLYKITVTSSDSSTVEAQDIDISDTLPPNLRFIDASTTGFTAGSFGSPDLPSPNTDCEGDACIIRYSGGSLPTDSIGEIIVRALIKQTKRPSGAYRLSGVNG